MKTQKIIILSLVALSIIFSCGKDDGGDNISFSDLFENTSENIIQPQYNKYKTHCQTLKSATEAFTNDVTMVNLEHLQDVFVENYKLWQHTSLYEFGPAVDADILLNTSINSYPTNTTLIDGNISSGNYNLDAANNIYAIGLPAFEYLIFGSDKNNNVILDAFSTDSDAANRKAYLAELADHILGKITLASERWSTYHDQYISNKGTGNGSSLTLLFNAYLKDYEETKRNKFALPAGFATEFSIPIAKDPNKVEGRYSDISFMLIEESILAHKAFFQGIGLNGVDGVGFFDKLKEYKATSTIIDGDLADVSLEQMDVILSDLNNYSGNSLYTEIQNSNPSLENTSLELQKLVPLIKVDMKSYFGVPITSQDTDGD